ncbi:MAG: type II toxin-antitoxin system HicB family antitoxin [Marinospirillum sp.]|uniref:type II toxin-antitoxin system HicB family antitoxin n=1 Tax=Marinospirillum sp. TaxID=2183934 RepID=UPI001A0177C4|nr:type II toxin-antitoxin system HicB family antitoxin [Marinospirillum sp.]MBE0507285.1 type II toxin-antitoxin system HicB family antitoxin [Marinospirillum sp.]
MLFPVAIERGDENHAHGVYVPDLPGCFSAGDTWDEALANAREAIEGHLEVLSDGSEPIPEAGTVEKYADNPDYAGMVWALVDVDITPYLGRSQKINVTLPDGLISRIDDLVSRSPAYQSRSGFLAKASMHELARQGS